MITEIIITIIACYLGSIVISGLMGFIVAHYEDYTYVASRSHRDLHPYYAAVRLIIFGFLTYHVESQTAQVDDGAYYWWVTPGLFFLSCMCTWSFFYNGIQYTMRCELSGGKVYKKKFFAKKEKGSDPNPAKINMSFPLRAFLFAFGTIIAFMLVKSILNL